MCVCMDYIFLLLLYMYHSTLLLLFLDYKRVAINITQSSPGLLAVVLMQSSNKSYLSNLCGQLAIVCLNSCRDLQTILICCDMSSGWAFVAGVGISENFSFYGFSRIFCLLVHFAVVLFVYKQASAHHVMNTDTG